MQKASLIMPKLFSNGLIVGKFAPLHLGHEFLIKQALLKCEKLYLISWSLPEFQSFEAAHRQRWLNVRFPNVKSWVLTPNDVSIFQNNGLNLPSLPNNFDPEIDQRQFVADFCLEVVRDSIDVVFTSESYGDGFAAHLSGCFGRKVQHEELDRDRQIVPISGTRLRSDIHGLRHFLDPEVYQDFVERVGLLGGESTGKSTLALALSKALQTLTVAEFGRELWEARNGHLTYEDMLYIGKTQVARENGCMSKCRRYLICDTTPLTTLFYSHEFFGKADAELESLAERKYKHLFLCADDIPFVQDGTRQGESFRSRQNQWYEDELKRRGWSYMLLSGSLSQRVKQAINYMAAQL
jgi:HTH-type transcriptional repressor of NAD biosynthesis genes